MSAPAPTAVRVVVPAKVNLALCVGPRRADGYHELATLYCGVSLTNEVLARPAEGVQLDVAGEGAGELPRGLGNLAVAAATALAHATGVEAGVRLTLRRGIPVAGGLAGGSADAAGTLLACNALWGCGLSGERVRELAAELGSDVPFATLGGVAVGTGRGELITPISNPHPLHLVLAFAHKGLLTARVFGTLARMRAAGELASPDSEWAYRLQGSLAALASGDVDALGRSLVNDLQVPALHLRPELAGVFSRGQELGCPGTLLCGSGPTVLLVCRDARHAREVAAALPAGGVCRAAVAVTAPVWPALQVVDLPPGVPRRRAARAGRTLRGRVDQVTRPGRGPARTR